MFNILHTKQYTVDSTSKAFIKTDSLKKNTKGHEIQMMQTDIPLWRAAGKSCSCSKMSSLERDAKNNRWTVRDCLDGPNGAAASRCLWDRVPTFFSASFIFS